MENDVMKFPQWLTVQATTAHQIAANYGVEGMAGPEKFYNHAAAKLQELANELQSYLDRAQEIMAAVQEKTEP